MVLAFANSLGFVSLRSQFIFELALETVDMKLHSEFQPYSYDTFLGNSDRSLMTYIQVDTYIATRSEKLSA